MLAAIRRVLRPGGAARARDDAPRPAGRRSGSDNDWRLMGEGRLLLEQRTFDPVDRRRADDADADRRRAASATRARSACASTPPPSCWRCSTRAGFADAKAYGSFDGRAVHDHDAARHRRRPRSDDRGGAEGCPALDRDAPEREPALELGLDRQVGADLGLQAQLALGVALLRAARGHERVEARRACSCRSSRRACRARRAGRRRRTARGRRSRRPGSRSRPR